MTKVLPVSSIVGLFFTTTFGIRDLSLGRLEGAAEKSYYGVLLERADIFQSTSFFYRAHESRVTVLPFHLKTETVHSQNRSGKK